MSHSRIWTMSVSCCSPESSPNNWMPAVPQSSPPISHRPSRAIRRVAWNSPDADIHHRRPWRWSTGATSCWHSGAGNRSRNRWSSSRWSTTLVPLALSPELGRTAGDRRRRAVDRRLARGIAWTRIPVIAPITPTARSSRCCCPGNRSRRSRSPRTAAHWTACGLPLVLVSPLLAVGLGVPADSRSAR